MLWPGCNMADAAIVVVVVEPGVVVVGVVAPIVVGAISAQAPTTTGEATMRARLRKERFNMIELTH